MPSKAAAIAGERKEGSDTSGSRAGLLTGLQGEPKSPARGGLGTSRALGFSDGIEGSGSGALNASMRMMVDSVVHEEDEESEELPAAATAARGGLGAVAESAHKTDIALFDSVAVCRRHCCDAVCDVFLFMLTLAAAAGHISDAAGRFADNFCPGITTAVEEHGRARGCPERAAYFS